MIRVSSAVICILLSLCFDGGKAICVDKNALYNVNATVHLTLHGSGLKVLNVNFYTLERYVTIDVTQANVTDLCEGIIKNFMNLDSLSLINVNLSRIEPEAFQKVPKLRKLSLAVNKLTEIVKGSFNNLEALEFLYLSANEISTIEENAFGSLINLRKIHLDRNKIVGLNGNLFHGCARLSLINLKFNMIESITKASFQDLRPNHQSSITIQLNKNRIRDVDPSTFGMSNPVILHLEGNYLDATSDLLYGLKEYSKLYLDGNQVRCLADDVIENMRNTTKDLSLLNNPMDCDCMDRIDERLDEVYGTGKLEYSSTFPCLFAQEIKFG
ncbi:unnamed protein product [Phaedon cochleariae]|uniref:Uncharacterized protein n=1 Tax=Phaedon cochleariae TaxID=80249 RepID=A0A9P0GRA5_PHACE|nr:unnamed protein product [Phaedon cochleariae]